ncbi:MAG: cytochrome c [Rhodospirillales bacterium]|nr:cytochrome c [Rhodospirillales bacterium]
MGRYPFVIFGILFMVYVIWSYATNPDRPISTSKTAIDRGRDLYAHHCGRCHTGGLSPVQAVPGSAGSGPNLDYESRSVYRLSDAELLKKPKTDRHTGDAPDPKAEMAKRMEGIPNHEIRDIIAFLTSTWPSDGRLEQWVASHSAAK